MRLNYTLKRPPKRMATALLAGLILSLLAGPAHAYLDPGTGSMLLQVILGGFAAIGVALKLYWHRITGFFRRGESPATPTDGSGD